MMYLLLAMFIILFLLAVFALAYRAAGREDRYRNIVKPAQEESRKESHKRRLENRDAEIEAHYTKRLKRAKRRDDPVAWLRLTNQMEKEKKITRRMDSHPDLPPGQPKYKAIPKGISFHPKTGHIRGGVGRDTARHHLRNPKPANLRRVKGASGGKQSQSKKKGTTVSDFLFKPRAGRKKK